MHNTRRSVNDATRRTYISSIKIAVHYGSSDSRINMHMSTAVCWDVTPCTTVDKSSQTEYRSSRRCLLSHSPLWQTTWNVKQDFKGAAL